MKLYIYDHCPYCTRARMIFGFKNIPVEVIPLLNDDVDTPTKMIGQKMVPILQKQDGGYMPESLDIVRYIDSNYGKKILGPANKHIEEWISEAREYNSKLTMPRMVKLQLSEFKTKAAIDYFQNKKEQMIGSFEEHLKNSAELITKANTHFKKLEELIKSESAVDGGISESDILLFPVLRNLTMVKGLTFPNRVNAYIKKMSELSGVPLYTQIAI